MKTTYLNIREIRTLKKFSQEYMARRLNIVVSAYSKIERGLTQLTIERLNEISKIFGVTNDYVTNYHLSKDKYISESEQSSELKNDMISLMKFQIVNSIQDSFESIMVRIEAVKPPYEEIKGIDHVIDWYKECGYSISSREDYENAPTLVSQNTEDQYYQGFITLMNNYNIYYYFKFGIYPERLNKEWERYKLEHDDSHRYPLEPVYDVKKMYELFNSIRNPNTNLFA